MEANKANQAKATSHLAANNKPAEHGEHQGNYNAHVLKKEQGISPASAAPVKVGDVSSGSVAPVKKG